jgi:hypothetical protein
VEASQRGTEAASGDEPERRQQQRAGFFPAATATWRRRDGRSCTAPKNGGVYYRDAQNRPVWLTVPNRPVQVPVADLQRYAPDYARYRGPAPAAPAGYRTQSFGEFDPNLGNSFGTGSSSGTMSGGGSAPGPRG